MKQIIATLSLLMLFAVTGFAQESPKYVQLTVSATGDTIAASTSDTFYMPNPFTGPATALHIKLTVVRVSGTTTGTAILQGSDDGTASSWTTCKTYTGITPTTADTATFTNAATTYYHWYVLKTSYTFRYFRVICTTTSGTQSLAPTARIYYKPED